jgi:hypothetical protein
MAYDKIIDSARLDAAMTATADAIRAKTGGGDKIDWKETNGFADALDAITAAEQATPTISVSSAGLITASATQEAGIVAAGTKSATQQLTVQAAKTVTPSTSNQTAVAKGRYTTGEVTVKGDANLKAANIASGVSIFGVAGTLTSKNVKIGEFTAYSSSHQTIHAGFAPTHVIIYRKPPYKYEIDFTTGDLHHAEYGNGDSLFTYRRGMNAEFAEVDNAFSITFDGNYVGITASSGYQINGTYGFAIT